MLTGCATKSANQQLDADLSKENKISARQDLSTEATQDLRRSHLIPEKKAKLEQLRNNLTTQENEIWKQSLKLRAVLIKDLLADQYDPNQIDLIKGRMWDLENKRISLIYSAVDEANKILGHFQPDDRKMIDDFFEMRPMANN